MLVETPFTIIFNLLMIALSMGFLIITLWYDIQHRINQFFAIFLVFMLVWNVGFLLSGVAPILESAEQFGAIATGMVQVGFVGASISGWALVTMVFGVQPRFFRRWTFFYLVSAIGFTIALVVTDRINVDTTQAISVSAFFFLIFGVMTLYVIWRYWRKIQSLGLILGILLFVAGQGLSFLNPTLSIVPLSVTVSSIGTLIISFTIIRRELITPLLERSKQLESMHEVSIAITSRIATDAVLTEIAQRAAEWLGADAAGIFLKRENKLELVAIHELPQAVLHHELNLGEGVAGLVATNKESKYLENYGRDWHEVEDLPMARATFGSVICVPLIYGNEVIGTLMVIASTQGTLFEKSDMSLLELLAAQAAVTISYGNLFNNQKLLTDQLASANEQLGTVLHSTDNPVLAVDRNMNLIFTNPAAENLFGLDTLHSRANVRRALPRAALPPNYRDALTAIHLGGTFRYEVELDGKIFLCHVARLGDERIEGFVAVLNDVSELKELDRIKSEMVRMTSHDLKNPLQAATANLELLREDVANLENAEISLSVNNIEHQLHRMSRIINGILDLERVRLGSNPVTVCHPDEIVAEALDELQMMADEQGIRLITQVADNVADFMGDVDQFKRALVNLIENAIKFNKRGGEVGIVAKNRAHYVMFAISDDGIGIPEQLQGKIFDRFYRAHQPGAEHITGTGLGLSLVKAVVESHNGHIRVESQPGLGTTFYITVPAVARKVDVAS
jgi:signal transduction histidine kinase